METNTLPVFFPPVVGVDMETTGLNRFDDKILAIGVGDSKHTWILTERFERLIPLFENKNILKIFHNFDFDGVVFGSKYKTEFRNIYDTLIIERVLNNGINISNALDDVVARRFGIYMDKTVRESFIGHEGPLSEKQLSYLEGDVKYLVQIKEQQDQDIIKTGMEKVRDIETCLLLPVLDATLTGMGYKRNEHIKVKGEIYLVIERLEKEICDILGEDFYVDVAYKSGIERIFIPELNWNSSKQVIKLLNKLGIKTKTSNKNFLESVQNKHAVIPIIIELKFWKKAITWDWEGDVNSKTGRIHPTWNQVGTDTGRFSAKDPNAQQIPRPQPDRPNFRSLFTALPDHTLICADYSQQEPRILAAVSGDPKLIKAANDTDIYVAFARDLHGIEVEKGSEERYQMKQGVLQTFYGSSTKKLASNMQVDYKTGSKLRSKILNTYKIATKWGNNQLRNLVQYGYSTSLIGRRRYFPEIRNTPQKQLWKYANVSRNSPIQSTGADITKLAMCKIYDIINSQNYDAHFIITLHDEVVISVNREQAEELYPLVIEAMESSATEICPDVKFIAEGRITDQWSH